MERYKMHIVRSADKRVTDFLKNQVKVPGRPDFGGLKGDIIEAKPTIYVLTTAVSVYFNTDSKYYHSEEVLKAINLAMDFVINCQREDGGFDYPSCNFKSAADTAFCFKRLIAAYRILLKYDKNNSTDSLKDKYFFVLMKALDAIVSGGFHTPNHRWAICAALLQGAGLAKQPLKAEMYTLRAGEYLLEGIDGNEDGEYAERSTGNYNAVVNNAMIAMYEESRDEQYLGYAIRNLHMMLTFIDPDDTIFTQNSTRQDQGKSDYADKYFYQYLYMTSLTYDPVFDRAAHKLIKDNMERGGLAPDCLHILMLHDKMMNYQFKDYGFLTEYRKFYQEAGVMRVKTEKFAYTIINNKSAFLFMKAGDTQIYVKIGESYGSVRNFIPQSLTVKEREYILTAVAEGWYYQPFKNYSGTSDWWKMDHTKREILKNSEIKMTVTIRELSEGLELGIQAEGLEGLPLRLEICIPSGAILENETVYMKAEKGSDMILKSGYLEIEHNGSQFILGPGFSSHSFKGHYSGEEVNTEGFTIYLNEYTPCEKTITLKLKS
jgi:hypothetical protein